MKNNIRTEKTKAAIFDAFWKIYGDKAINKITVSDVTKLAGVHRSTFYLYFEDIYDLLAKAEDELLAECDTILQEVESVIDDDNSMLDVLVSFYANHVSKLNALLGAKGDPGFSFAIKERMIPHVLDILAIPRSDKEMRILMDYMITAMLSLLTYSYANMPEEDINVTIQRIHTVMSIGIVPMIEVRSKNPEILQHIASKQQEIRAILDGIKQIDS